MADVVRVDQHGFSGGGISEAYEVGWHRDRGPFASVDNQRVAPLIESDLN
jgi:hypothetical protein